MVGTASSMGKSRREFLRYLFAAGLACPLVLRPRKVFSLPPEPLVECEGLEDLSFAKFQLKVKMAIESGLFLKPDPIIIDPRMEGLYRGLMGVMPR